MEEKSKKITGETEIDGDFFLGIKKDVSSVALFEEKLKELSSDNVSKILELVLSGGMILGLSDIHIEPEESGAKMRARIDGVLYDVFNFDKKTYQSLLSRIKLLSGLKLNITQESQDGGFTVSFPEVFAKDKRRLAIKEDSQELVEIRTSILPSEHGEAIVMRLLNPKALTGIDGLGLRESVKNILEKEIKKPNGMIIVTGPTGSGKTTTLYAILGRIKKSEIKIVTIEDPVEYHMEGISQTEVHQEKGYDFANGLSAIVRQDPDIILVGEIRDLETAQIALQASLTGHLVLTTLHTNDASGAVARLQTFGEQLHNIASAINMVIAQRLVRIACSCAKKEKISENEYQKISAALEGVSEEIVSYSRDIELLRPVGCQKCNNTGYKGRVGIFEFFVIDDEMKSFILTSLSSAELRKKAINKGMLTMYQDGLIKVIERKTTLEELERVVVE